MLFPMHIVMVRDFLKMTEAQPHQVLKSQGVLEEYDERRHGVCVFISHQWCSRAHPDPEFAQLGMLQALLRRLTTGQLHVEVDFYSGMVYKTRPSVSLGQLQRLAAGCLWYDYFAVPQPVASDPLPRSRRSSTYTDLAVDMGKAVFSIPAYVELCKFFIVLAPPVPHQDVPDTMVDYHSWKQRGWCRLERVARILSPRETHILCAWKDDVLFQVGAQDYLVDAVGDGDFTMEQDRYLLAPVMVSLMENKLQALLEAGNLHGYRRMLSARNAVLHGLPDVSPRSICAPGFQVDRPDPGAASAEKVRAFLRLYGLASVTDRGGGHSEAILFASAGGDKETVQALLECRADIHAREGANDPAFFIGKNMTPLHLACRFGWDPSLVRLLLRQRADLEARSAMGGTPLSACSTANCQENVAVLLAARASVNHRDKFHCTPLHVAAFAGRAHVCTQLIRAGASARPTQEGGSPLMLAVMFGGGRETVEALLQAKDCDSEAPFTPPSCSPIGLLALTLSIPHRLWGSKRLVSFGAYQAQALTPLMLAAMMGNISEARALLRAGADPGVCNARGKTAAELGELMGLSARNVAYLQRYIPYEFEKEEKKLAEAADEEETEETSAGSTMQVLQRQTSSTYPDHGEDRSLDAIMEAADRSMNAVSVGMQCVVSLTSDYEPGMGCRATPSGMVVWA